MSLTPQQFQDMLDKAIAPLKQTNDTLQAELNSLRLEVGGSTPVQTAGQIKANIL